MRQPLIVFFIVAASLISVAHVLAGTEFVAILDGQQNVPPIPAVTATGSAMMTLSDDHTELSYFIEFSGLSSAEIDAHFHKGNPRENGPAAFALPPGSPKIGVWAIPLDAVTALLAGELYINIHTDDYIQGEIRGNIGAVVPVEDTTWGRIKSLYGAEF